MGWMPLVHLRQFDVSQLDLDNVVTYASYKGSQYVVYVTPPERSALGFGCVVRLLNNSDRVENKDQELAGLYKIQVIVSAMLNRDEFSRDLQNRMNHCPFKERLPKLASTLKAEIVGFKPILQAQGLYDPALELIDPILVR